MKSLARKEVTELLVLFTPVLAIAILIWCGTFRLEDVLIAPRENPLVLAVIISAGAGLLVAQAQFQGERARRTFGFLMHREGGVAGTFRTKVVIGSVASVLLGFLPPFLFACGHAFLLGNAPVIHWERVVESGLVSTVGAGAYAATVLALCLRRGLIVDFVLALLGIGGLLMASIPFLDGTWERSGSYASYAAANIAGAIALLALAGRIFATWPDSALPLARGHHALLLVVAALLWMPIPLALVGGLQCWMGSAIDKATPWIVQERASGEFLLAVRADDGGFDALDGDRRVRDARLAGFDGWGSRDEALRLIHGGGWYSENIWRDFVGRLSEWTWEHITAEGVFDTPRGRCTVSAWFDREAGALRHFALRATSVGWQTAELDAAHGPPRIPSELVVQKPAGSRRFSPSSVVLHARVRRDESEALLASFERRPQAIPQCIADPEDYTLWKCDLLDFANPLTPIEMPADDRFVGVEKLTFRRKELSVGRFLPSFQELVRGEKSLYEWNGSALVRIDDFSEDEAMAPFEEAEKLVEIRTVATDPDPLAPHVEVRDERTRTVLFEHTLAPVGAWPKLCGLFLHAGAVLRPPVVSVASFLRDTRGTPPRLSFNNPFVEPLLANRSRPWLLGATFLLAGSLVVDFARRAKERGVGIGVVVPGVLLVACFGVFGYLLAQLLEPRRAWRAQAASEPIAEPVLLIRSA